MSPTRRDFIFAGLAAATFPRSLFSAATRADSIFWYDKPAERWLQALPVGNGRLGAMVFGEPTRERLDISESTLWSGAPSTTNVNPDARDQLPIIREHLFAGRYVEADELCLKHLLGRPEQYGTALPMAFIEINTALTGTFENYRRMLNLDEAIAEVAFTSGTVYFTREVFASHPGGVIVVRLACDKAAGLSCTISFGEPHLPGEITAHGQDTLALRGHAWESMHSNGHSGVAFECRLKVMPQGGTIVAQGTQLIVQRANAVTLLVAAASDFSKKDFLAANKITLASAAERSFSTLRKAHVADHQALYRRVSLSLESEKNVPHLPMDERRRLVVEGQSDPELCALFFQYGRYLTIAGSREDSPLPLALQGIWNDGLAARMGWTDDFHMDINTEQNYWVCEVGNLPECHAPLFNLVEGMRASGAETAHTMYGAPGWVSHGVTNAWGYTAPGWGLGWGLFVTGGVWIALQLWDSFRFSRDREFLRKHAYPVLRAAGVFVLAYMVEHPGHKWLVTGPSISPENRFRAPGSGEPCSNSMGPTCDRVLVYALLSACIEASVLLGVDMELRTKFAGACAALPPLQIGRHGQLQEWLEDFDEAEPGQRHTSNLIALYPENQISPHETPKLAHAARVTIERRTSQVNWEDVEWSRANLVNYYARLLDAEAAHHQLLGLIAYAADDSLLTYSRGGVAGARSSVFAIDGNIAGAAAVAEMLLQSQSEELHLLPALPAAWPHGSVRGLRARGGIEVSMRWVGSMLVSAILESDATQELTVRYSNATCNVKLHPGRALRLRPANFLSR